LREGGAEQYQTALFRSICDLALAKDKAIPKPCLSSILSTVQLQRGARLGYLYGRCSREVVKISPLYRDATIRSALPGHLWRAMQSEIPLASWLICSLHLKGPGIISDLIAVGSSYIALVKQSSVHAKPCFRQFELHFESTRRQWRIAESCVSTLTRS
jgi:hypothetical protein